MIDFNLLTGEQFVERKLDLPEGGRWHELVAGKVVQLQPPDVAHGTTLLNFSKALADYLQRQPDGYACFELGLIVGRDPDTVRCPAVSFFVEGDKFAESDKTVTDSRPALVVEIASTNDRRRTMRQRVDEYLAWGVQLVWVADPNEKQFHIFQPGRPGKKLGEDQSLLGQPVINGFEIRVGDLFLEPEWWTG